MASDRDYKIKIQKLQSKGLLKLWQHIQARNNPDWGSGKALEYFILRAFELEGAEVVYPYTIYHGDDRIEQIDGVEYGVPNYNVAKGGIDLK
jgi:hypothetical protein